METNLKRDLDYTPVLQALIDKTVAGKLAWEDTATPNEFFVTVSSSTQTQSFRVLRYREEGLPRQKGERYALQVRDDKGEDLFEVQGERHGPIAQLFDMAQRIAKRIDEKIVHTVDFLKAI